jgi:hypothetical protein
MSGTERSSRAVWAAGLVVAAGAAVLTAHGLIEVALGSGVPVGIGWLYPVITDGLALVAYATTTRLHGPGRAYAWAVVVLAAGLSALAQAAYLAGGAPQAVPQLRFVVGAWPAVAAAIAAHLLFLIGTTQPSAMPVSGRIDSDTSTPARTTRLDTDESTPGQTMAVDSGVSTAGGLGAAGVQPGDRPGGAVQGRGVQLSIRADVQPVQPPTSNDVEPPGSGDVQPGPGAGRDPGLRRALSPIDRARTAATLHARRHGEFPTVRQLAALAEVGRGTAGTALQELNSGPQPLHLVTNQNQPPTPEGTSSEKKAQP